MQETLSKIKLKMMEFLGLINKFNLENQVRFIGEDSEYFNQNNLHFQSLWCILPIDF